MDLPERQDVVDFGCAVFRVESEQLDEKFMEQARVELRETPEVVAQSLKEFRELVKGEPKLNVPLDDNWCKVFLRPCKWYPTSAFGLMKRFYRFKEKYPHIFGDLVPENNMTSFLEGIFIVMPLRDRNGCRIVLMNGGKNWNPKTVSLDQMFKALTIILVGTFSEPKTQIAGVRIIMNMDGFTLSQATYLTPSFAAMTAEFVQKCMPCRLKSIHVVNQPYFFNMVYALFKPFLLEKTRKRILFHGRDKASLYAFFEPEILPVCTAGKIETLNPTLNKNFAAFIVQNKSVFYKDPSYGYTK